MTDLTKLALATLTLVALAIPAQAASEQQPTNCMNRCQSYRVYCNSEVLRQIEDRRKTGDESCTPDEVSFNLGQCVEAAKDCEDSCLTSSGQPARGRN